MARTPDTIPRLPLKDNPTGQGLILTTLAMLALGVVVVHSAALSIGPEPAWYTRREIRHTLFAAAACLVLVFAWRFNYRRLMGSPKWMPMNVPVVPALALLVAIACGAMVFLPGLGRSVGGFHRWIRLGPEKYGIGFQPSELIKLTLVIFLAAWLTRPSADVRSWKMVLPAVLITGASVVAIVTEDFGTAAIICIVAGVTMLLAGVPILYLLAMLPPAAGAFYVLVVRNPMRWARITAMTQVWAQDNPTTYQPRQSLIAILSGGWTGKGPGNGLHKMFLPENTTDFIFSVFCEEWGFIGAILLMGLVFLWLWHSRRAAVRCDDRFGRLLAGSLGFLIGIQAAMHIAVDLVVAPPTGMSFPFMSAGGTALVMMAAAVALMVSVTSRPREQNVPAGEEAVAP